MRTSAIALTALLFVHAAHAGELAGVTLPDQSEVDGKALVLNGLGLREATVLMVDVYVAGLYLESKSSDPVAILSSERPKRLVMSFVRSVGKEKLADAWTEGFQKNAGADAAEVAPGLATLNAAMADVKKGDVIALTYVPAGGTTVSIKGHDVATIPGAAFQKVLFSIWLGANPPNVPLREGLLGRSAKG
jgi:hypothetical protein